MYIDILHASIATAYVGKCMFSHCILYVDILRMPAYCMFALTYCMPAHCMFALTYCMPAHCMFALTYCMPAHCMFAYYMPVHIDIWHVGLYTLLDDILCIQVGICMSSVDMA